ncbi:hypothetical protein K493DRAFT_236955, partial [Basidiobolus meristosporus CBS 931.73]
PGTFFIVLEFVINITMIVDVGFRLVAFGKIFWKSAMNIFDVVLVALCIGSLIFLFMDCTTSRVKSELAGTVFLVIRNTIQFFRLFNALRKYVTFPRVHNALETYVPNSVETNNSIPTIAKEKFNFPPIATLRLRREIMTPYILEYRQGTSLRKSQTMKVVYDKST